ncbi:hypothetical protein KVT40_002513 [Elsinoe batatas]|uniref:Protein kinase domain-containing protein n=1 Tax=Elsinoe batatas TaxID=2601811 RepID=A0A8K0PIM1_9PEZI|nr:hypothetical protein KVT40_002513 [Elsinoe batatas]
MGTRHFLQAAPTADLMALNAGMYGFAEAGLLTPHYTVKRLWWTAERIDETVNRRFVVGHIRGHERQFLDRKIIYHTLTNDTYLDWILFRAPRLFLTLVEIRCAERIFSLVDDGWDDSDLPVPWKDIERLDLNIDPDHILNRRFYEAQYTYLLRQLEEDYHIEYGPNEYIPMEYVGTIPPAVDIKDWHRIHFPDEWRSQFVRRQFDFGENEDERRKAEIDYLEDVKVMKKHQHYHLCDVWASYTNENSGFTLSTYIGEHTLKTFMDHRTTPQYTELAANERPCLLLEWMHCLADVLAFLHTCDKYHGEIRPSNILVDSVNCVAFSDIGHLKTFKKDKRVSKQELHDYTAPELLQESPKSSIYNPFAQRETSSTWKVVTGTLTPKKEISPASTRHNSVSTVSPTSPITASPVSARNFSRHLTTPPRKDSAHESDPAPVKAPSPLWTVTPSSLTATPVSATRSLSTRPSLSLFPTITPIPSAASTRPTAPSIHTPPMSPLSQTFSNTFSDLTIQTTTTTPPPQYTPQAADVFSLGCIYLDILTFLVLGKTTTLQKFRRSKSITIPSHTSYTPSLIRSGASTPVPQSSPGVFSSASSVISSYASPLPTSPTSPTFSSHTSRFSLPPKGQKSHFPSDPIKLHAWTSHLLSVSSRQGTPFHSSLVELLPLVKQMLAPNPSLRPSMQEVRSVVEEILSRQGEMKRLCCRGRRWRLPEGKGEGESEGAQGVGSKGRRKGTGFGIGPRPVEGMGDKGMKPKTEKDVPRAIVDRLWELRRPEREEEKRRKDEEKARRQKEEGAEEREDISMGTGMEAEGSDSVAGTSAGSAEGSVRESGGSADESDVQMQREMGNKGVRRMEPRESRKLEELRSHYSDNSTVKGFRIGNWRFGKPWR